jgi:hypothetical protein
MEAVRLTDGKECQTLEKSEIIALIEALCERPLEDRRAEPPAELRAFCREAAKALSQAEDGSTRRGPETVAEVDQYTAALARLLSGADAEAARRTVAEATLRSAADRLDAESAVAFVDAIEQSPQTAPSHLVEEILAADHAAGTGLAPRRGAGISAFWLRIAGGSWWVATWRVAAACAVVLVAGVTSLSIYWQETGPSVGGSAVPIAKTTSESRSVADAPAPPKPVMATTTPPCEPSSPASEAVNADPPAPAGVPKAASPASTDCASMPGHQFADRPANENEAIAARKQAEAARQAARARAAGDAASKVGAAQAGREPGQGPVQADRSGMFETDHFGRPSATMSAPAAAPAVRPTAPAAQMK